ncbi:MAG: HAF repeat-containing protein [Oxalobacteraceae bacterium]|nr:HAF repeat-containing protein [Oxalobacteraceae bacterium]
MQNIPVSIRSFSNFAAVAALAASLVACGGDSAPASSAASTDTASLLALTAQVKATPVYRFTDLGALSVDGSVPYTVTRAAFGINKAGDVVGINFTAGELAEHATLWKKGNVINLGTLDPLSSGFSVATGINDRGQIVGYSGFPPTRALLWNGTTVTELESLGGFFTAATAINKAGRIVGWSQIAPNAPGQHAVVWDGTTAATDLGTLGGSGSSATAINDAGQIVGSSSIAGNVESHATLWKEGAATDLGTLGGSESHASAINDAGQIVGSSSIAGNVESHATLWKEGAATDLGTLGGQYSHASGINKAGQIVGYSLTADNATARATIWNGTAAIDLNTLLDSSGTGITLLYATAINDAGQIVGTMTYANGASNAFLLTPINSRHNEKKINLKDDWKGASIGLP